jgi:hypothetical protein
MIAEFMESNIYLIRSLFFFGINDEPAVPFEIPYPNSIPEMSIISELYLMENFCGKLSGLLIFNEPVDVEVFRSFSKKHPNFMTSSTDLQNLQNIFQDNLNSIFVCLSPLNKRWQENSNILVCPLSNRRVEISPDIVISCERENSNAIVESLDLLILIGQSIGPCNKNRDAVDDGVNPDLTNKLIEDAFVEYLKFLIKTIEEDRSKEEIVESNLLIPKFRACIEATGLKLTERMMKYIINLIRTLKNPTLVSQAFNDLILNPYLLVRASTKARELYQEFLIVYYSQLICMPQFKKYLAKRVLLVEVVSSNKYLVLSESKTVYSDERTQERVSFSQPSISIKPSFHFSFCGFYFKLIRKLPTEELIYLIETIVLMILCHPNSDFTYSLLVLIGNIIEHLKENSIVQEEKSNRLFYAAEEALIHSLLTVVTNSASVDLKIEALKQYMRYFIKLLVEVTYSSQLQKIVWLRN